MKSDLERYGIKFDEWFFESSLHNSGYVKDTVEELHKLGWTYEKEGALWLKTADIQDVGAYFAVADAKKELSPWALGMQVSSRGYMLGYHDLKDPSVSGFFRFLSRVGDNSMNMQIVRLEF